MIKFVVCAYLVHLFDAARVKEHSFSECGFAAVNVGRDANIPQPRHIRHTGVGWCERCGEVRI